VIVLDTSVLSHVFRRTRSPPSQPVVAAFRRLVEEDAPLAVPGVVFQELLSGVRTARAFRDLEGALAGFPLLLADRAAHRRAAEVRNACRTVGAAAASFDCLIAAQAINAGAELWTLDGDFARIALVTTLRLARPGP